jgi:hypothetical protein
MTTKAWTPLPAGMISPAWSHNDYRIAYLKESAGGTATVTTLDVSKTTNKPVALTSLNAADLILTWPNKTSIILAGKGSAYAQSTAWLLALPSEALTELVPDSFGFEGAWSNTTSTTGIVLSSLNYGRTGSLSLVTSAGVAQPLTLATLPSKCAFSYQASASTTPFLALYCAVPTGTNFSLATLPDDYNQMALFTNDSFYMINTASGATQPIFAPSISVDATNVRLFNNILFFVNRYDNKLYAISLSGE